jgi:hypothetical protein
LSDRVFIPTGEGGVGVFERITASKPVVDLIEKNRGKDSANSESDDLDMHVHDSSLPVGDSTDVIETSADSGDSTFSPCTQPPDQEGIFLLANRQYAKFQHGLWYLSYPTPKEAAQSEWNIPGNMIPSDRYPDQSWVLYSHGRKDAFFGEIVTPGAKVKIDEITNPTTTNVVGIAVAPTNGVIRQEGVSMEKAKKPFHEVVAEKLIAQLEQGTAPWQRPWNPDEAGGFLPYNPLTGKRYKGINTLNLLSEDRNDNRWMTYKQAGELGGQVREGEKSTGVQYWKFTDEQIKRDDNGNPVLDGEGKPVKVVVKLERPRVFFASVFNAEQIDGLPPLEKKEVTWNPIERAENILAASRADIHHNGGSRAFYRPSTDSIHLPEKGQFPTAENYYAKTG